MMAEQERVKEEQDPVEALERTGRTGLRTGSAQRSLFARSGSLEAMTNAWRPRQYQMQARDWSA